MKTNFFFLLFVAWWLPLCNIIAQQWYKVPHPNNYHVYSLRVIDSILYIGGSVSGVGGTVIFLNDTQWSYVPLGTGQNYSVEKYNNELFVGGDFPTAQSGQPWPNDYVPNTQGIAKWDGTQWKSVYTPPDPNGDFYVLKFNNDLYAGGNFTNIGNLGCKRIARYDGNNWYNVDGGVDGGPFVPSVASMAIYKGELYVTGNFTMVGSSNLPCTYIAKWDGTQWSCVGGGLNGPSKMFVDTINDVLYCAGGFNMAGGIDAWGVAKWDGNQWSAVDSLLPAALWGVSSIVMFDNKLYVTARASVTPPYEDSLLYRYDGIKWEVVFGPNMWINTLEVYKGNLYAGGLFDKIDTTTVNYLACYGDSCPGTPITLTLPYSVNEINKPQLKFKVYPNPAKKEITIEMSEARSQKPEEKYIVRIKNSLGQEVFTAAAPFPSGREGDGLFTISTADYKKGLYLVEVCTSPSPSGREGVGLCHTEKVVVE